MLHFRNQSGVTLVEIMVGVAIIGILSAVVRNNYATMVYHARQSEAKVALSALYNAQQSYVLEAETYGACLPDVGFSFTFTGDTSDMTPDQAAMVYAGQMGRFYRVGFMASQGAAAACGLAGNQPCITQFLSPQVQGTDSSTNFGQVICGSTSTSVSDAGVIQPGYGNSYYVENRSIATATAPSIKAVATAPTGLVPFNSPNSPYMVTDGSCSAGASCAASDNVGQNLLDALNEQLQKSNQEERAQATCGCMNQSSGIKCAGGGSGGGETSVADVAGGGNSVSSDPSVKGMTSVCTLLGTSNSVPDDLSTGGANYQTLMAGLGNLGMAPTSCSSSAASQQCVQDITNTLSKNNLSGSGGQCAQLSSCLATQAPQTALQTCIGENSASRSNCASQAAAAANAYINSGALSSSGQDSLDFAASTAQDSAAAGNVDNIQSIAIAASEVNDYLQGSSISYSSFMAYASGNISPMTTSVGVDLGKSTLQYAPFYLEVTQGIPARDIWSIDNSQNLVLQQRGY